MPALADRIGGPDYDQASSKEADRVGRRTANCAFGALGVVLEVCALLGGLPRGGTVEPDPGLRPARPARQRQCAVRGCDGAADRHRAAAALVIINEPSAAPRVLLWDELKIGPLMAPPNSGMTTTGGAGK